MADRKNICNQLHLPFQAGSNRILKQMRRAHTREEYLEKTLYIKQKIPDIVISTDIIVGFPGETDSEFEETLDIMKQVRFFPIYAFKYSPRPGTRAAGMEDNVPVKVKEERLERVFRLQQQLQMEFLESLENTVLEIMIENAHPKERHTMNGRTAGNIPVSVKNSELEIGATVKVRIIGKKTHSLIGEI